MTFGVTCHIISFVRYAAMAQVVEHVLGKDEVTSSNLVSSSNKGTFSEVLLFFMLYSHPRIRRSVNLLQYL